MLTPRIVASLPVLLPSRQGINVCAVPRDGAKRVCIAIALVVSFAARPIWYLAFAEWCNSWLTDKVVFSPAMDA